MNTDWFAKSAVSVGDRVSWGEGRNGSIGTVKQIKDDGALEGLEGDAHIVGTDDEPVAKIETDNGDTVGHNVSSLTVTSKVAMPRPKKIRWNRDPEFYNSYNDNYGVFNISKEFDPDANRELWMTTPRNDLGDYEGGEGMQHYVSDAKYNAEGEIPRMGAYRAILDAMNADPRMQEIGLDTSQINMRYIVPDGLSVEEYMEIYRNAEIMATEVVDRIYERHNEKDSSVSDMSWFSKRAIGDTWSASGTPAPGDIVIKSNSKGIIPGIVNEIGSIGQSFLSQTFVNPDHDPMTGYGVYQINEDGSEENLSAYYNYGSWEDCLSQLRIWRNDDGIDRDIYYYADGAYYPVNLDTASMKFDSIASKTAEADLWVGDEVIVDGKPGLVDGNPGTGEYYVRFDDGTDGMFKEEEIQVSETGGPEGPLEDEPMPDVSIFEGADPEEQEWANPVSLAPGAYLDDTVDILAAGDAVHVYNPFDNNGEYLDAYGEIVGEVGGSYEVQFDSGSSLFEREEIELLESNDHYRTGETPGEGQVTAWFREAAPSPYKLDWSEVDESKSYLDAVPRRDYPRYTQEDVDNPNNSIGEDRLNQPKKPGKPSVSKAELARRGMTVDSMAENVYAAYKWASDAQLENGLMWYPDALNDASTAIEDHPDLVESGAINLEMVVGVFAAISPNLAWEKNILYPSLIIQQYFKDGVTDPTAWRETGNIVKGETVKMAIMNANREKVIQLFSGGVIPEIVKAHKTRNFYSNIMGNTDNVTVDIWATRICMGELKPLSNVFDPVTGERITYGGPADSVYNVMADSYRLATQRVIEEGNAGQGRNETEISVSQQMTPREMQAITWVVYRDLGVNAGLDLSEPPGEGLVPEEELARLLGQDIQENIAEIEGQQVLSSWFRGAETWHSGHQQLRRMNLQKSDAKKQRGIDRENSIQDLRNKGWDEGVAGEITDGTHLTQQPGFDEDYERGHDDAFMYELDPQERSNPAYMYGWGDGDEEVQDARLQGEMEDDAFAEQFKGSSKNADWVDDLFGPPSPADGWFSQPGLGNRDIFGEPVEDDSDKYAPTVVQREDGQWVVYPSAGTRGPQIHEHMDTGQTKTIYPHMPDYVDFSTHNMDAPNDLEDLWKGSSYPLEEAR